VEGLFLGNREAACDLRRLREAGITHIVNCAEELPNYHEGMFVYLPLRLRDPDPQMHLQLDAVFSFIDEARREKGRVLVHCFASISRSPAIVLSYLCHLGDTIETAARRMGGIVWTDPDWVFLEQLARRLGLEYGERELIRLSWVLQGRHEGS
jgi:hypothetical protein